MRRLLAFSLTLAVAACVAPPAPPPPPPRDVPRPRPAPPAPPPPPPAAEWRDWPVTAGTWVYERDARGSRALFGPARADALLVLRCDLGERRMFLSRAGSSEVPLAIRTSSASRSLAVRATGGALPYVAAALVPTDPLLDAMAFSRGKIAISQPGTPLLVVPSWAEIGRVIEDCRG